MTQLLNPVAGLLETCPDLDLGYTRENVSDLSVLLEMPELRDNLEPMLGKPKKKKRRHTA